MDESNASERAADAGSTPALTGGDAAGAGGAPPPPPPPPAGSGPDPGRFDFSGVLALPFRDPQALNKFVLGSIAVLFIPFFGLGLFALMGYGIHTARGVLRGDEHPMPDWAGDFGGLLVDGLKATVIVLVHGAVAVMAGLIPFLFGGFLIGIGEHDDAPGLMMIGGLIALSAILLLILLALLVKAVLPASLTNLAATGSLASGFAFGDSLGRIRQHVGNYVLLLLTLIFVSIVAEFSLVLCVIGILPGMFWQFATFGSAIGHAGKLAGVRVS